MELTKQEKHSLLMMVFRQYQKSAKKRGHEFALAFPVFGELVQQTCAFCGSPPSNLKKRGILRLAYNGIDRLDSNIGYVEDNCVPCCRFCNSLKGAMSFNSWADFLNGVVDIHGGTIPFPGVKDPGRASKSYYKARKR